MVLQVQLDQQVLPGQLVLTELAVVAVEPELVTAQEHLLQAFAMTQ
jgi:hypothetical protein